MVETSKSTHAKNQNEKNQPNKINNKNNFGNENLRGKHIKKCMSSVENAKLKQKTGEMFEIKNKICSIEIR